MTKQRLCWDDREQGRVWQITVWPGRAGGSRSMLMCSHLVRLGNSRALQRRWTRVKSLCIHGPRNVYPCVTPNRSSFLVPCKCRDLSIIRPEMSYWSVYICSLLQIYRVSGALWESDSTRGALALQESSSWVRPHSQEGHVRKYLLSNYAFLLLQTWLPL